MSSSYNLASDNKGLFLRRIITKELTETHRKAALLVQQRYSDTLSSSFCRLSDSQRFNLNEADTIRYYITPFLEIQNFKHREKLRNENKKFPDIWLFLEEPEKQSQQYYQKMNIGILEAKARYVDLDLGGDSARRPANQLAAYLKANQSANPSRAWGILCNGSQWRIYKIDKPDRFFSFDLEHAIENLDELALMCLLISPEAFSINRDKVCLLDLWHEQSLRSWKTITTELKCRCPRILKSLVEGAFAKGRAASTAFHISISSLFRLLFILHVESRGFFKRADPAYADASLRNLLSRLDYETFPEGRVAEELSSVFSMYKRGNTVVPKDFGGEFFAEDIDLPWRNETIRSMLKDLSVFSVDHGDTYFFDYGSLSVEVIGDIYETIINIEPLIVNNEITFREPTKRADSEANKIGATYTPANVVNYLVSSALDENAVRKPTICDPACGSGHFLVAALRQLGQRLSVQETEAESIEQHLHLIAQQCIYGADINGTAAQLTRLMLAIESLDIRFPVVDLRHNVVAQDSLQSKWKESAQWFNLFFKEGREPISCFDVVVGNPPYVRARAETEVNNREKIMNSGQYSHLSGSWDLWLPFVQLALGISHPQHGRVAMVVSEAISYAPFAEKYNQYVATEGLVSWVSHFDEKFFGWSLKGCCFMLDASKPGHNKRRTHKGSRTDSFVEDLAVHPFMRSETESRKLTAQSYLGLRLQDVAYVSKGVALHSHKRHAPEVVFSKDDLLSEKESISHPLPWIDAKQIEFGVRNIRNQRWVAYGAPPFKAPKYADGGTFIELHVGPRILVGSSKSSTKCHYLEVDAVSGQNLIVVKIWSYFKNTSVVPGKKRRKSHLNLGPQSVDANVLFSRLVTYELLQAIFMSSYFQSYIKDVRRDKFRLVPNVLSEMPIPVGLRAPDAMFEPADFGATFQRRIETLRSTPGPQQQVEVVFLLEQGILQLRKRNFVAPELMFRFMDDLVELLYLPLKEPQLYPYLDKNNMLLYLAEKAQSASASEIDTQSPVTRGAVRLRK